MRKGDITYAECDSPIKSFYILFAQRSKNGKTSWFPSLIYENEVHKNGNTLWIKVSIEDADQGWISAKLIDSEDLRLVGIE